MQRPPLFDSIFTRLVSWAVAVSIAVVLVLGWLVATKFERMSEAAVRWNVDYDISHLSEILGARGPGELVRHIDQSSDPPRIAGSGTHYMLVDSEGRKLAGDLSQWPRFSKDSPNAGNIALPGNRPAYARAVKLSPELRLVAAQETGWNLVQLRQIRASFVAGGLFVVLAVGIGGYLTARRLAHRVKVINAAFRDPDPERLAALNMGESSTDEIGELTRHASTTLARLGQLARSQRDATDQVAHEMRTPLMHLDNRLVRAIQAGPDAETTRQLVAARAEIRHVVATLESLLDIAHSEAQRGDPHGLQDVDVSALAANIADLYTASAEETGHVLRLEAEHGVIMRGDEIQLSRLITNLLDNAFKYVPSGGTIRLIVKNGPLIAVADNGPGIRPEFHERIFERFGRGDDGIASGRRGAGLGLALARAIALRHGMELRLAPSVAGARFELRPL